MKKEKFDIEGMTCTACAAAIERTASSIPGVSDAVVNFATEKLDVSFNPEETNVAQIVEAVSKIGYKAIPYIKGNPVQSETNQTQDQEKLMRDRMIYSLIFTVPLFYLSMGPMVGLPIPSFLAGEHNLLANALTQLLLCLPVLYIGAHFYKDGFKALWHRVPNMDSLIAVGTSAAFFYSIYVFYMMIYGVSHQDMMILHHYAHDIYFESTVVILALISVGKYMETRAKGKTSQAIEKLIELTPDEATVIRDGKPVVVPLEEVLVGDLVQIKPGEKIPVDGVVKSGNTSIDESFLTGESIPIEKAPGSTVSAGSINKTGSIVFEASRIGEDTSLAKIIALVEEAQSTKAPIARLADNISKFFVPAVMLIALAAFLVWLLLGYGFSFALSIGIAILVISCPCALGLATPTAIMVGTGVGAKHGILFKNGEALETLGKSQAIVFDKTGTLTIGKPVITNIYSAEDMEQNKLLQMTASLEAQSEHPLAEAIIQKAQEDNLDLLKVTGFEAIVGKGVKGIIDNSNVLIGNPALMSMYNIPIQNTTKIGDQYSDEGKTPLYIAIDNNFAGIIAVADVLKENTPEAINQLNQMGIETIMLTGDNQRTAKAIAQEAGIKEVIAEVLPDQKASVIAYLQEKKGLEVTMIGDGINDAPALVQANNGIAIGTGTDVAIESADIILMQSDLMNVPTAVQLSKATLTNIKQNLFWAFIYNVICIPLAAGLLYIPFGIKLNAMFAAAAMSLSSVSVVLNALSLRGFKLKRIASKIQNTIPEVLNYNSFVGIDSKENSNTINTSKEEDMEINFKVNDMSCQHCVNRVKSILEEQPGVLNAQVDLEKGQATIECEPGTNLERIAEAVTAAGYPTTPLETIVA